MSNSTRYPDDGYSYMRFEREQVRDLLEKRALEKKKVIDNIKLGLFKLVECGVLTEDERVEINNLINSKLET